MKIEILGPGCPKCGDVVSIVSRAVTEMGIDAEIVKVTDVFEIIDRGVIVTPALAIDGRLVFQGRIPTYREIKDLLWVRLR